MRTFALVSKSFLFVLASGCFAPDAEVPSDPANASTGESDPGTTGTSVGESTASATASATTDHTLGDSSDESGDDSTSGSTGSDETSSGTGEPDVVTCGDGVVDEGEACDDGNDEDRDACTNACVVGFHTGSLEPCGEYGVAVCGYFEADCRVDPGPLPSLCYWSQASSEDACDDTPGIWTEPDSPFGMGSGYDFPPDGACITQLPNLRCADEDAAACTAAGGDLCFQEVAPGGGPLDVASLCWWDVDEAGCADTPGTWTTADSGFGQGHPNALPPSDGAACLLQVTFL